MKYRIDFTKMPNYVLITTSGSIDTEVYPDLLTELTESPDWRNGNNLLVDHRLLDQRNTSPSQLDNISAIVSQYYDKIGQSKCAFVGEGISGLLIGGYYCRNQNGIHSGAKIFLDIDEAIKWLSDISVFPKETPKKYQLTNCVIEQLSNNVFEATPKEGIVVDKECVGECWKHWDDTQKEPFGFLINCKNMFSFSFEGAREVYGHPLQQKTGILADGKDYESGKNITFVMRVKEMAGLFLNCKIFNDREEAIKWLSDIVALPKEAPIKYELSFCEIEQLSENVFETKSKEGVILDEKCVEEGWTFWNDLRDKPYGLLVNCEVPYNLSFIGARDIGNHPLQHKTAIFCNSNDGELRKEMKIALDIRKSVGDYSRKLFSDREEAIKWMSDI